MSKSTQALNVTHTLPNPSLQFTFFFSCFYFPLSSLPPIPGAVAKWREESGFSAAEFDFVMAELQEYRNFLDPATGIEMATVDGVYQVSPPRTQVSVVDPSASSSLPPRPFPCRRTRLWSQRCARCLRGSQWSCRRVSAISTGTRAATSRSWTWSIRRSTRSRWWWLWSKSCVVYWAAAAGHSIS